MRWDCCAAQLAPVEGAASKSFSQGLPRVVHRFTLSMDLLSTCQTPDHANVLPPGPELYLIDSTRGAFCPTARSFHQPSSVNTACWHVLEGLWSQYRFPEPLYMETPERGSLLTFWVVLRTDSPARPYPPPVWACA